MFSASSFSNSFNMGAISRHLVLGFISLRAISMVAVVVDDFSIAFSCFFQSSSWYTLSNICKASRAAPPAYSTIFSLTASDSFIFSFLQILLIISNKSSSLMGLSFTCKHRYLIPAIIFSGSVVANIK